MDSGFQQELELFGRALELPVSERAAFLDAHASSPQLRKRVGDLLARAEDDNDALERPLVPPLDSDGAGTLLAPGSILTNRYRIVRHMASGTFGAVYEASDTNLSKAVVVKVLKSGGEWVVNHFEFEKSSLARLRHPGIVSVTDHGTTPRGAPYIVLDFISGHSLQFELKNSGALALERAGRLIEALGDALEHAHQRGVIHRDLKPGNIMLSEPGTQDERPVIIDFGIAKRSDVHGDATSPSAVAGTRDYWAFEQAMGDTLTTAVDIFALGMIAFEMLTGTRFRQLEPGLAGPEVMARRLAELAPAVPVEAAAAVARCIATDPAERPSSARDAAQTITRSLMPRDSRPVLTRRSAAGRLFAALGVGAGIGAASLWYRNAHRTVSLAFHLERHETKGFERLSKPVLSFKDNVRLLISSPEALWVYLFSPTGGKLFVLFPVYGENTEARLIGPLLIPGDRGFVIDSTIRPIEIWIAVARQPIPLLERVVTAPLRLSKQDEIEDASVMHLWDKVESEAPREIIEVGRDPIFVRFAWALSGRNS